MSSTNLSTSKAIRTKEHLLTTAFELFVQKGYQATTMRDIATDADCSLGLAYRYFAGKEALVAALYHQLAAEMATSVEQLPPGPLALRFEQLMRAKFANILPYRDVFKSLLGVILNPQAEVGVLNARAADIQAQSLNTFVVLLRGATDAPREEQIADLAMVLYTAHLGLLLFWFYDPTPQSRATEEMLALSRDTLGVVRRFLRLPPLASTLRRLARALAVVFGPQQPIAETD